MTVPCNVPSDMIFAYMEGVRCGRIRDEDPGYTSEIDEILFNVGDSVPSPIQEKELAELKEKQRYFEQGFTEGKLMRSKLKGGVQRPH